MPPQEERLQYNMVGWVSALFARKPPNITPGSRDQVAGRRVKRERDMATYAIGDVQGCYDELCALLEKINYDETKDTLWFAGDLVNRGPKSLQVLRLIKSLPKTVVVLGNHDLHLLALAFGHPYRHHTLQDVLTAHDCEELITWLRQQPLLHYDAEKNYLIVHAGLTPKWDLQLARACAKEVETILQDSAQCPRLLQHMYGDQPDDWSTHLQGWDRYRYIINVFTRIRFCDAEGRLILHYKGTLESKPPGYVAWFDFPKWQQQNLQIMFGHWAALNGVTGVPNIIALDTGCVWGNELTAFCLETSQRFSVRSKVKNS